MTSRREFIQRGIATTAVFVTADSAQSMPAAPASTSPHRLATVVYDARFPEPARFANAARARGASAYPISGDMTGIWYRELHGRWKTQPAALAGMTRHGPLFCFHTLARDYGMRLVYQAEHAVTSHDVLHTVSGGRSQVLRSAELIDAGASWPDLMAEIIADTRASPARNSQIQIATSTPGSTAGDEPLFTWVIAPVPRT